MFSCSLKNGTTIEYRISVSLLIKTVCRTRDAARSYRYLASSAHYADLIIVYQANPQLGDSFSDLLVRKYPEFALPRFLKPRGRFFQVIIGVSRMAHEFGAALRQVFQQPQDSGFAHYTGLRDTAEIIGGGDFRALGQ